MSISSHFTACENELVIGISGKFDFTLAKDFRDAYAGDEHLNANYVIDLKETEHMDSSALGMLLNMRKHLGNEPNICITNCSSQITKILTISRFDKKFSIN